MTRPHPLASSPHTWRGGTWSLLLSLHLAAPLAAQAPPRDPHAVQPERPTVATHAHTVATGWLEFELGGEYDRYTDASHGLLTPLVTKLGLGSHAQLNIMTALMAPPGVSLGLGDLTVGIKWRLLDEHSVLGDFAILPSIKLPTGSSPRTVCPFVPPCFQVAGTGTGTTDVSLMLISSRDVGPVAVDINAGYTRRSGDGTNAPKDAFAWTASFGGSLADNVGWVLEAFGYPGTTGPAGQSNMMAVLGGPTFAATPWLSLDVGGILPITGPQPKAAYVGLVMNVGQLFR